MRFLRFAMVLGSATVLVVGLAGPASAAEKTVVDVRGDAVARLDVTKVTFRHNDNGAHAKVRVRDLRNKGQLVFAVANRRNNLRFGVAATGRVVMAVGSTRNFPSGPTVDRGPTVILSR